MCDQDSDLTHSAQCPQLEKDATRVPALQNAQSRLAVSEGLASAAAWLETEPWALPAPAGL